MRTRVEINPNARLGIGDWIAEFFIFAILLSHFPASAQNASLDKSASDSAGTTWSNSNPTNHSGWVVGVTLGAGPGVRILTSAEAHGLAVASLHVGRFLRLEKPEGPTFMSRCELSGELWTGAQFHPDTAYIVGLTPIFRYHFRPHARWSPFADLGAGITATDIGLPDLCTVFQFNLQAGAGFHWRWREDLAFTFQTRFVHISNARIELPNLGANTVMFSAGLTWFY